MFGKKNVKNILVITDQERDNINLRNQLEKEAISCYGNLYGLRLSENKKVTPLLHTNPILCLLIHLHTTK
jgi:hypothetical protein